MIGDRTTRGAAPASSSRTTPEFRRNQMALASRRRDSLRELCHDMLEPAATIAMIVKAAEVEAELPPVTKNRLRQVELEANTISQLCHNVLRDRDSDYRSGATELDVLALELVAAARMRVSTEVRLASERVILPANRVDIRRALWNLIENAIRAAGGSGVVAVSVSVERGHPEVSVADSGGGFGAAAPGKAGLGLRIAKHVMHSHGGEVRVGLSEELGGAKVTLAFPANSHVSERSAKQSVAQ